MVGQITVKIKIRNNLCCLIIYCINVIIYELTLRTRKPGVVSFMVFVVNFKTGSRAFESVDSWNRTSFLLLLPQI